MISRRDWLAGLALAPAAPAIWAQAREPIYDLLLKNGLLIDPRNNRHGRFDVAVVGDKIARVAPNLPAARARRVVEAGDYYLTPGLIDLHTHFDAGGADLNLQPDHHALPSGVTTAVDAGSTGAGNFEAFRTRTMARSRTRLLAWLNIAANGLAGTAAKLDAAGCASMAKSHPAAVVGIIASAAETAERAIEAARSAGLPVMVERAPGDPVLARLEAGDIVTTAFGPKADVSDPARAAQKRGILFDTGSFWFRVAVPAVKQGFLPDIISTNINKESILLTRANMVTTLSKFLNIGLTIEQLIERSTVAPARAIRRPELGHLGEGSVADIALLEIEKGKFGFLDSGHTRLLGDRRIRCVLTVRAGRVVWDTEGLSLTDWSAAGPYSNFR